ncbi:transposase, partial [[Eubacterium] rectale]|uniref:IS110 family transposase n=1 Tax=Agathobacter rectalis TaxID=39491 RepID=UPI0027D2EDA0
MIYIGIDVAKDKHDCFITNSDSEVLFKAFTIANNLDGFNDLYQKIESVMDDVTKVKVGPTYVINPLHTNLYRKSLSLRQTKTDKVDARTIASMLMSDVNLKSYSDTFYHNEELKSLTRYRFDKVKERAKLKTSVSRLVCILFPELEKLVPTLHIASVYALLSEFPSAKHVATAHLTRLTNLLSESSKGRYGKDTAIT